MTITTFLDRFRRPRPPFRPLHPGEHSESPLLPLLTPIRPTPRRQLHPALPDDHSYSPPSPSHPSLSDISSSPDRPPRDPTRTVHFAASDAQLPRTLTPVSPTTLPTDPALLRHHLLRLLSERTECLRIIDLSQSLPDQPAPPTTVDTSVSLPARLERALHLLTTETSQLQRRLADLAAERDTLRMQLSASRRATPHKPCTPNASFLSSDSHALTNSRAQSHSKASLNPSKPRSHSIDIPAQQQQQQHSLPQRRTAVPVRTLRFSRDDSALQSQLSTLRQQRQRDRAEISDLSAQLRTLRQKLDIQLRLQRDQPHQETRAHSSHERKHMSANRDASPERASESNGLKRRLSAAQKERERVEQERDAVRQLLAGTLSDKAMLSTRVQTLLDALASRADAARRAEQMLARHTAASDAALRAARSQLERVRGDASSLQSRVDAWRRDVSDRDARQRDEVFRLRRHGEELQKRVLALRDVGGGSMSATEGTEVEDDEFEDVVCGVESDSEFEYVDEIVTEVEQLAPADNVEISDNLIFETVGKKEIQRGDVVVAQISRITESEWTSTLGEKLDDGKVVPYLGFRRMRVRSIGSGSPGNNGVENVLTEVCQEELENVLVRGLVALTDRMGAAAVEGLVLPEKKAGSKVGSQVVNMMVRQETVAKVLRDEVGDADLEGQGFVGISFHRLGSRTEIAVAFELVAFRSEEPDLTFLQARGE